MIVPAAGRERCYRVSWDLPPPTVQVPDTDTPDASLGALMDLPSEAYIRKDANEVLVKDGRQALQQCIDLAEPLPIRGLFRLDVTCICCFWVMVAVTCICCFGLWWQSHAFVILGSWCFVFLNVLQLSLCTNGVRK